MSSTITAFGRCSRLFAPRIWRPAPLSRYHTTRVAVKCLRGGDQLEARSEAYLEMLRREARHGQSKQRCAWSR